MNVTPTSTKMMDAASKMSPTEDPTPSDQSLESMSEYSNSSEDPSLLHAADIEESRAQKGEKPVPLEETVNVNRSKIFFYIVLALLCAAVGATTFIFTSRENDEDFETKVRTEHGVFSTALLALHSGRATSSTLLLTSPFCLAVLQLLSRDPRPS
jgi:hypothetical protein